MNFEVLEQRTLFAGAHEAIDMESASELPPEFNIPAPVILPVGFSGMEMMIPTSELNFIAGEALVSAGEILNEYLFEPVIEAYNAASEIAQDYYNLVDGAGEGLSDYSEATRHTGHTIMFGSVAYSYMRDPTLTTMYVRGSIGAAIWGVSKIMPYAGAMSSFVGSTVESFGGVMGGLGSMAANHGSDLAV